VSRIFKPRHRRARALARIAGAAAMAAATLAGTAGGAAASTLSFEQWAAGYLSYLGVPASGAGEARVVFLERWATVEGTFYLGNVCNPLDTELPAPGAGLWNSAGVRTYPSLSVGYRATLSTMQQSFDAPILAALRNPKSTRDGLAHALASSNWTGYGQLSSTESGYASVVAGAPAGPVGPQGPGATENAPAGGDSSGARAGWGPTTVVVRGAVVNPLGHPLSDVCVAAVPEGGLAVGTLTAADGSFRLSWVPEAEVRLRLTDCGFAEGGIAPAYYHAAARRRASPEAAAATVIDLRCKENCGDRRYRLAAPIVYGTAAPEVSWVGPTAITYGTPLGVGQLDATASVRGTFSYSPAPGTLLAAGERSLSVLFTPRDKLDYRPVHATAVLTVGRATPSLSWPSPGSLTYGTALDSDELGASASVHGSFSYHWPAAAGTVLNAGSNTLSATFTPSDGNDYASAQVSTTLSVTPAKPTISFNPAAGVLPGSTLRASELAGKASAPGSFSYSPPLGTPLLAGTQDVSVIFTPANSVDYTTASQTVPLTASRSTPEITWPAPHEIAAGSALTASQLDARTSVAGTYSYDPPLGSLPAPGTDTLSVTFTPTDAAAYEPVTATTPIVVANPLTPTVSWSAPHPITYGSALSSAQLDARSPVPGTFAYSPPAGSVLGAGAHTLQVTFTPTNTAAFASITESVTLAVAAATPALNWPAPTALAAGSALSSTQLDATASVAGTFSYSPAAGSFLTAGSHTLQVTFTPTDGADYTTATAATTLVATQASPVISWPAPAAVAAGSSLSSTQLDATASVAGTFSYSPAAGSLLTAGSHTLQVTFTPTDSADYTTATASVAIAATGS